MVRTDPWICSLPALVARAYLGPGMDDFVEQYRRHWTGVVAAAHAVVGRAPEAEEIAQEVFVRLWRAAGRWTSGAGSRPPHGRASVTPSATTAPTSRRRSARPRRPSAPTSPRSSG